MTTQALVSSRSQRLLQLGILLFLLGLLVGFAVPSLANPRMALASHLEGIMNGLFLAVLGLVWPRLTLPGKPSTTLFWLAIYGTFANWAGTLLAAFWGAGASMPLAAGAHRGSAAQELIIDGLLISLALGMIGVCVLTLWGLRAVTPKTAAVCLLVAGGDVPPEAGQKLTLEKFHLKHESPSRSGTGRQASRPSYRAPIVDLQPSLPSAVAAAVSSSERAVDALNRNPPQVASLEVLARRLLRAESVASSRIEGVVVSQRRLARAEADEERSRDETAQATSRSGSVMSPMPSSAPPSRRASSRHASRPCRRRGASGPVTRGAIPAPRRSSRTSPPIPS